MKAWWHTSILAVWLLAISPAVLGEITSPNPQPELPPGVQIYMQVTPKPAAIGDPIRIEFDIAMPAGSQVDVPPIEKQIGDFFIFDFSPGPTIPETDKPKPRAEDAPREAGAPAHHRIRIMAAAYRTGALTFPPLKVHLRTPDGKQWSVASPPAEIEIRSILSERDRDLKDLKKQVEMPEPIRWGLWLAVLLAAVIAGAAAWFFWKRRQARAPAIPSPPPQDILEMAEAELRALLTRGYPEGMRVKPFYVRLSDISKRILEAGYSVHAAERTTAEIMEALSGIPEIIQEDLERVETFLRRCDMVKFAKYTPTTAEHESSGNAALEILETCRRLVARRRLITTNQTATGS